jgi:type I restriction-modification system DNA methylase subunit
VTVLISLAKKITPKLKNLILEEITKDETISLQLFLSFIVIKVLEAKGLIKKSMRIFEDDVKNPSLLSKYLYLIQILHNNFNNFDAIFSIIHKITEKNLKNIVFLFKETSDENWNNEEIISWCYEYYNYPSEKKAVDNSQFYTPAWIVEFLIEHTLTKNFVDKNNISIEKIRIIDPACGCGNFIIQIYDALKNIYLSKGYEPKEASKMIITHNLYGVDIDEIAVEITNLILKIKAMEDGVLKIRETNFVSIPYKL